MTNNTFELYEGLRGTLIRAEHILTGKVLEVFQCEKTGNLYDPIDEEKLYKFRPLNDDIKHMMNSKIEDALDDVREFKKKVREAVANYMSSEGCSCCQDYDRHKIHKQVLGELLDVEPQQFDNEDEPYYNFYKYKSK